MEFVESDDGQPFRRPPDLDDRIWRHPSEMGAVAPSPRRLVTPRMVWVIAVAAAVGASALSTGLVIGLGGLRSTGTRLAQTVATVPGPPADAVDPVVTIAERARPAIAQIRVQRAEERASGSGVIFRSDGQVLTNAHVIDGASSIQVVLSSGREVTGKLVGSDPVTDVAVVKAEGGPFTVAEMGTAANLKVGQLAVAMGSPLALVGGPSVTVGVVSALHRSVRSRTSITLFDMIQTDAPIAPGSSGGALLDGHGRVIGITTAMAVSDMATETFGFATPIDIARSIGEELMATGKATHAWLGIEGSDIDGATAHDLSVDGGAMVRSVKDGGPAAAAGLAAKDVILSLNGKQVLTMGALAVAVRAHHPGDEVQVEILRDKQRSTRRIVLAERPPDP